MHNIKHFPSYHKYCSRFKIFTNHKIEFIWTYFIKSKIEALSKFKDFNPLVENISK
jgi:hypothetical protein